MRMIKLSVFVLVVFALGMIWVSCSKPPEAEKEAAKKAMDAAFSAGADKYAPADLGAANKVWDTAESRIKEEKYNEAKESYIGAKAAFEKAAAAAEAGRNAAGDQANAAKEAAKKATDGAISAGADKYASAHLDAARRAWDTAESQMKERMYKEAKESYSDAKAAFEKAAAAVEAGKKAAADQAKAALKTLEEKLKKLRVTAKKMEKKLKDRKQAWTADAKAIKEGLGRSKEMIASAPAEAKAKLDELKTMIDRWEATFKEMATSASKPKATKKNKS
jgi:colicin import membrane protein